MKRKTLALLVIFSMVLALLGGCGGSSSASVSPDSSSAEASASAPEPAENNEPEAPAEEPAQASSAEDIPSEEPSGPELFDYELPITTDSPTYSFLVGLNPGVSSFIEDFGEAQVIREWMTRTGINVEFISVHPSAVAENFSLFLAANDLPDITDRGLDYYTGSNSSAIEDEIFADLAAYRDACPNYFTSIEKNDLIKKALTTDDGYVAAFYMLRTNYTTGEGMLVRQDWLDQLGMDIPTTYDEVHDVLTAFKNEMNAVSPMMLNSSGTWSMGAFGWGYGMNGYMTTDPTVSLPLYVVDGEVRFAMLEDAYVDYLTMISQWYSEGLIVSNLEDITMYQFCDEYIINDETGYFYTSSSSISTLTEQAASSTFAVTPVPLPTINKGDSLNFGGASFDYDGGQAKAAVNHWTVSAGAEDIETLLTCLDYFYSPEGSLLANYGVEGVSFEYDGNGAPCFTDLITNNDQGMTLDNAVYVYTLQYGAFVEDYNRYQITFSDIEQLCADTWTFIAEEDYTYPADFVSLTTEESETYAAVFSDISTVLEENILKFITGANSMDDYPAFQEQLYDMGIAEIVEIYQNAYDRFMAR